jgi:APA family basic amino acid/polyamine antiporter
MVALPPQTWERLIIWLVIGLLIYFAYGKRRARAVRDGRIVVEAIGPDLAA